MNSGRIDENSLPVIAPGAADFVRVVDRATGASRNALMPEVTGAAAKLSEAVGEVIDRAAADANGVLAGLGYLPPVPYSSGLEVNSTRFTVIRDGHTYAPAVATPFVTASWSPAQWRLVQGVTASDVAAQIDTESTPIREALLDNFKTLHASIGMGGRGMIAITVDDGHPHQFEDLLPISKRMGFPMGVAWHHGLFADQASMVAKAHAAGWEIQSHLSDNTGATNLTESQLRADAAASVSAIAAITGGDPENIAFVYPQHLRNAETDRILSEYFIYGRGRANLGTNTQGGHVWMVGASALDTSYYDTNGVLTEAARKRLRDVAANDAREVFYIHYQRSPVYQGVPKALENFVSYARELGIQIVRPSDVRGNRRMLSRWLRPGDWTLPAGVEFTSERSYGGGQALKITTPSSGTYHGFTFFDQLTRAPHSPGRFSVIRTSLRYSADADIVTQNIAVSSGIRWAPSVFERLSDAVGSGETASGTPPFKEGGVIPAADWRRIDFITALPPSVSSYRARFVLGQLAAGSAPLYIDDLQIEVIDTAGSLSTEVTLEAAAGGARATAYTGVLGMESWGGGIALTPKQAMAGSVFYQTVGPSSGQITVFSDSADDAGKVVRVTVTPGGDLASYDIPETVA